MENESFTHIGLKKGDAEKDCNLIEGHWTTHL